MRVIKCESVGMPDRLHAGMCRNRFAPHFQMWCTVVSISGWQKAGEAWGKGFRKTSSGWIVRNDVSFTSFWIDEFVISLAGVIENAVNWAVS